MTPATPGAILALVAHARHVPAVERERFATRLRQDLAGRALLFETCHRVEGYLIVRDDVQRHALAAALPAGGGALIGEPAVRHAITVAVGGDSVVAGEDQVLHQLREAVNRARAAGALDTALGRLFALALQAGRRARSWRPGPQRSLADVALTSIKRQAASLHGRDILVVGAGRMGRLAVQAAIASGASVAIANRSPERADAIAAQTGARVEAFDPGPGVGSFAGVVVALGGPWPIGSDTIGALIGSQTILVDLSVPAAVPDLVAQTLGPRFVSADALAREDVDHIGDGSRVRVDALVDRTAAEFLAWLSARDGRATAEELVNLADHEREAELTALWRRLPDLEPEAREAIKVMTEHLAARILRQPLERLGRDTDGHDEQAVRDIFAL